MARVIVTRTLIHDFAGVSGGGRSFGMDQAVICHLEGGKIAEAWEIADVASLIDQVRPDCAASPCTAARVRVGYAKLGGDASGGMIGE